MRRKRRAKQREERPPRRPTWSWGGPLKVGVVFACAATLAGAWFGLRELDAHVDQLLLGDRPDPVVEFVDLPKEMYLLANHDLHRSLFELLGHEWIDDQLCVQMATRLVEVGWVGRVNYVRRTGGGRFEISCRYRLPTAMVMVGENGYLVDADAVRLPGSYVAHRAWRSIDGAGRPAPSPGRAWEGDDVRAALGVLSAVASEPYADQIVGVSIANFAGRRDPRATHVELLTDRPGGRIRWGSPPGLELEENGVPQKLALLRENFGRTGRADALHLVIDISVFPDRFTVPG